MSNATVAPTNATPAAAAAESSMVPAWMNVKNADGTWNMAGLFFWLVMLAILVVVLQQVGLLNRFLGAKIDATAGKGEEFYSDL